jgi:hypothetical protein
MDSSDMHVAEQAFAGFSGTNVQSLSQLNQKKMQNLLKAWEEEAEADQEASPGGGGCGGLPPSSAAAAAASTAGSATPASRAPSSALTGAPSSPRPSLLGLVSDGSGRWRLSSPRLTDPGMVVPGLLVPGAPGCPAASAAEGLLSPGSVRHSLLVGGSGGDQPPLLAAAGLQRRLSLDGHGPSSQPWQALGGTGEGSGRPPSVRRCTSGLVPPLLQLPSGLPPTGSPCTPCSPVLVRALCMTGGASILPASPALATAAAAAACGAAAPGSGGGGSSTPAAPCHSSPASQWEDCSGVSTAGPGTVPGLNGQLGPIPTRLMSRSSSAAGLTFAMGPPGGSIVGPAAAAAAAAAVRELARSRSNRPSLDGMPPTWQPPGLQQQQQQQRTSLDGGVATPGSQRSGVSGYEAPPPSSPASWGGSDTLLGGAPMGPTARCLVPGDNPSAAAAAAGGGGGGGEAGASQAAAASNSHAPEQPACSPAAAAAPTAAAAAAAGGGGLEGLHSPHVQATAWQKELLQQVLCFPNAALAATTPSGGAAGAASSQVLPSSAVEQLWHAPQQQQQQQGALFPVPGPPRVRGSSSPGLAGPSSSSANCWSPGAIASAAMPRLSDPACVTSAGPPCRPPGLPGWQGVAAADCAGELAAGGGACHMQQHQQRQGGLGCSSSAGSGGGAATPGGSLAEAGSTGGTSATPVTGAALYRTLLEHVPDEGPKYSYRMSDTGSGALSRFASLASHSGSSSPAALGGLPGYAGMSPRVSLLGATPSSAAAAVAGWGSGAGIGGHGFTAAGGGGGGGGSSSAPGSATASAPPTPGPQRASFELVREQLESPSQCSRSCCDAAAAGAGGGGCGVGAVLQGGAAGDHPVGQLGTSGTSSSNIGGPGRHLSSLASCPAGSLVALDRQQSSASQGAGTTCTSNTLTSSSSGGCGLGTSGSGHLTCGGGNVTSSTSSISTPGNMRPRRCISGLPTWEGGAAAAAAAGAAAVGVQTGGSSGVGGCSSTCPGSRPGEQQQQQQQRGEWGEWRPHRTSRLSHAGASSHSSNSQLP